MSLLILVECLHVIIQSKNNPHNVTETQSLEKHTSSIGFNMFVLFRLEDGLTFQPNRKKVKCTHYRTIRIYIGIMYTHLYIYIDIYIIFYECMYHQMMKSETVHQGGGRLVSMVKDWQKTKAVHVSLSAKAQP